MRACTLLRYSALIFSMLLVCNQATFAQYEGAPPPPPASVSTPAQPAFSQPELDQMLAPIALYPDPLLSQILMASTYPLEVVEAARWSRANPMLKGDDAVRAVQQSDWDPSVKSLVAFPQMLQMMDEKLAWTERLGDAFLAQESQVMDTVQNLRQKAYAAGYFKSNDQVRVEPQGQIIVVEPASPDVIYVPYYDPTVVYGSWWWSDYPPIYWAPWPDYYFVSGFAWGLGITISTGFFFGDCDWHHHRVNVVNVNNYYYGRHDDRHASRNVNPAPGIWHHDPDHRRGVPYRDVSLRQQYGRASASPEGRREFRGYDQPAFGDRRESGVRQIERGGTTVLPSLPSARPGGHRGTPETRTPETRTPETRTPETRTPETRTPETRTPETRSGVGGGQASRPYERGAQVRPNVQREERRPTVEIRPPAFEDIGRGRNVRDFSSRGRASSEGAARNQQRSVPAQRSPGSAPGRGKMQRQR